MQDLSVMMMRVVVGELERESGDGGGSSGCDDSDGEEVDMELGEEESDPSVPDETVGLIGAESEDEDDLPNMLRSFCFHDAPPDPNPIPMNCSNRPATVS